MKLIVTGAKGKMGGLVIENATVQGHEIVAKVDPYYDKTQANEYRSIEEVTAEADCIVDFSFHTAAPEIAAYAQKKGIPVLFATTGFTAEEKEAIRSASESVAVFNSSNLSLGIAALCNTIGKVVALFPDADIEIVETHHNRKADAPSGTAIMLFNAIQKSRPQAVRADGRSGMCKRSKDEVGIQAVRMGNIVGIHEVKICTNEECITLRHDAFDRGMFAKGALVAAAFLVGKGAGFYDMNDVLQAD